MSLLDDVSIVVTPNGYKAGTLFAVKPTDVLGAEEITNGDFSNGLTGWTENGGSYATIVSGALNSNNPDAGNWYAENISQNVSFVNGTTYKLTFKAKNISGNLNLRITQGANAMASLDLTSTFVNYTYFYTANADNGSVRIFCNSAVGQFEIDNISVKEVTGADMDVTRATAGTRVDENGLVNYAEIIGGEQVTNGDFATDTDWTKNASWTIANGKASYDGSGNGDRIKQNIPLTIGKRYTASLDILDSSGRFRMSVDGGSSSYSTYTTGNGTYTFEFTSSSVEFSIRGSMSDSANTFSIDNVSVKEVTRDNVPRIDYTGGGCPHVLAEPQRTNLITYSEELSATTNVTLSNTISPDGTLSGLKINETTSNSQHYSTSYEASVVSGGTIYTVSFYIKKGTYDLVKVYTQSSRISVSINITFSTESTNASGSDFVSGSNFMEDAGNGWYRVGFSATANTTGEVSLYLPPKDLSTYAGDISQYTEYWGMQIEQGSYATSYIPTSGSTVTRNQDIFTRDGIGSLINSTEGVLFIEMAALSESGNYRELGLSDGTTSNRVLISYKSTDNVIRGSFQGSGGTNLEYTVASSEDFHKIAVKWKVNDFALWVDGVERATDTSGSSFPADTLNSLNFNSGAGGDIFYGKVKQLQVYKTALTDTQLAALTS